MITVIFFLFFYLFIYFIGRGLIILFKFNKGKIYDIPINILYPIIALFYIGNVALIINFFFKITTPISLFILLVPLSFNFSKIRKFNFNLSLENLSLYLLTPLILGISSSNINLAYDAGLYHLNHQHWIRNEKIIFGLSNNHNRFGYSSIVEHINVNFWLDNNFILLHFTNLIFIVVFFQIIYLLLFTDLFKFSISILLYGFLDNFGFNGGKNGFIEIESIAKQDTPFAIIFIITTYFLFKFFNDEEVLNKRNFLIVFMFSVFSIELRLFGFINILFFLLICINKYKFLNTFKIMSKDGLLISLLGISFILKNLITSSCMFYPVKLTCFDSLPWQSGNYSSPVKENNALADFHIALTTENYNFWLSDWMSKEVNNTVFKNALITFFLIVLLNIAMKYLNKESVNKNLFLYFFYCLFSLIVWLITAPSIRMGVGIFLSLVLFLSILFKGQENKFIKKNALIFSLFYFLTLGLVPQTNNYFSFIDNLANREIRKIEVPVIEYRTNETGYGVLPKEGDQCWVNLECVRNKNVSKDTYYSYIIFRP